MAQTQFLKFFDKEGHDMNLLAGEVAVTSWFTGLGATYTFFDGTIYFDRTSVGLIDSQQVFMLEEVTGSTASYYLRKIPGIATLTSGNPIIYGSNTDFTKLLPGQTIKIPTGDYTIVSILGATSMQVFPVVSTTQDTEDFYLYDYTQLDQLKSSPGSFKETLNVSVSTTEISSPSGFTGSTAAFFLYDVEYADVPLINRSLDASFPLVNGSADTIDPLTGKIVNLNPHRVPVQINLGFSNDYEWIFDGRVRLELEKQFLGEFLTGPSVSGNFTTLYVTGATLLENAYSTSRFYLQGVTAIGSTQTFFEQEITPISAGVTGSDSYFVFDTSLASFPVINTTSYHLLTKTDYLVADLNLYGEAIGEDERLRLVLENFGRKIDFDKEYIFRDSDISEELPDYVLLNQKRKELLLQGDTIYPYIGSYRALINVLDYFGYNDVTIKEYFLNVDKDAVNYGKYLHLPIAKNEAQRALVKKAWQIVPSKVYKKTSLFGLYYNLNELSGDVDDNGIPIVIDSFMFTPEEVLIKLFGLKELLKKEFLPLNARIYDITGEGIYFDLIRLDTWTDNLQKIDVNLGGVPDFSMTPNIGYISDLRRLDDFYRAKFIAQGLTGFLGATAFTQEITALGYTGSVDSLYGTYVGSYANFLDSTIAVQDPSWNLFPPGIVNPDFNYLASLLKPLSDDTQIPVGAPLLLEVGFDLAWEDANFTWNDLSILDPSGNHMNVYAWTWETLGRGQNTDMQWVIRKPGPQPFNYDSGRRPIDSFTVQTRGATTFSIPAILEIGMSGGTVLDVQITNPGFGYTTVPNVIVQGPTGVGTTATISVTIAGGYVNGATWTGGTGYGFTPVVTIDPPVATYETVDRVLHAVALPYAGDYEIGLFLYDITNNVSMHWQKYTVLNKEVDFIATYRKTTTDTTWEDLEKSGVSWEEVSGPWWYPLTDELTWENADITWESLELNELNQATLIETYIGSTFSEINRSQQYVKLSNDFTSFSALTAGNYLFFDREATGLQNTLYASNNSLGTFIPGNFTGFTGDTTVLSTLDLIGVGFQIAPGDSIFINQNWYTLTSIGATSVTIAETLLNSFIGYPAVFYSSGGYTYLNLSTGATVNTYANILVVEGNLDYEQILPTDFYGYLNVVSQLSPTYLKVKSDNESNLRGLIARNVDNWPVIGSNLCIFDGVFDGDFAIKITNVSLTGSNTLVRLQDSQNELYLLDGNFNVRVSHFDVQEAYKHVGLDSLNLENNKDVSWNEASHQTFFSQVYVPGSLCGFVIPFVAPSSMIQVDEEAPYQLSSNPAIQSTKVGLKVAALELQNADNAGLRKFSDWMVLPDDELYLISATGASISVGVTGYAGSFTLDLTAPPTNLLIPATIEVTATGGTVDSVTITNAGYGYTNLPTVTVPRPHGGFAATISVGLSGSSIYNPVITYGGTGYTSIPTVSVDPPAHYSVGDESIWNGTNWMPITGVSGSTLILGYALNTDIDTGSYMFLPYGYHKQELALFVRPDFYFFIHARATTPSAESLSYIRMSGGIESDSVTHPTRSDSYPLNNAFLKRFYGDSSLYDYTYQFWNQNGADYPPQSVPAIYRSPDRPDYEARAEYVHAIQQPYSFSDLIATKKQTTVPKMTLVVFHFDPTKIPSKQNPVWTIFNEDSKTTEVEASSNKLMWNFTKAGNFTVSLKIDDVNGNTASTQKVSFVIVE